MTTTESAWTEEHRDQAMALIYLRDTTCSGCAGDLNVTLEEGHVFDVDFSTICHSCRAKEMMVRDKNKEHEKDKPNPGRFMWADGRIPTVRPMTPEEVVEMERAQRKRGQRG